MQWRLVFAKYTKPVRDSSLSLQNLNTNAFQMFEKYNRQSQNPKLYIFLKWN